ncbi:tetratricopeptide repeat protein, partial [Escherichia coli]
FVNWLYNHSSVLHERAEIIKCAEMLMQEDDFEICESILRQQKLLWERIDETLSEEIVQKCRNINGEYVWPWILPFSAAGMKHTSIQHQGDAAN